MDNRINPNQLGQLGNIGGALPSGNVNANQGFDFGSSPALLQAPANFGGAQGVNGSNPMAFQGGQGSGSPMLDLKEMGYQIASLASTLKQQIMNRGQQGSGLQQFSGPAQGIGSPTGTGLDPSAAGTGQGGAYQAGMDIPGVSSGVENTLGNLSSTLSTANFGETSQWLKELPQQAEQRQASEGSESSSESGHEDEEVSGSEETQGGSETESSSEGNEDEGVESSEETEGGSEAGSNQREGENRTEGSGGSEATENSSNDNIRDRHNRDSR